MKSSCVQSRIEYDEAGMTGVLIIAEVASTGCAFLLYFLFALLREGRRPPKSKRAEIRVIPEMKQQSHKPVRLHAPGRLKRH